MSLSFGLDFVRDMCRFRKRKIIFVALYMYFKNVTKQISHHAMTAVKKWCTKNACTEMLCCFSDALVAVTVISL